ncbi:hypothetical protein CR513_25910, partial [Mucuna pruriens]
MDIYPAYNYLLRRPWIHKVRVVPSSLHQKVKFIANHQLVSVMGERELVISTPDESKRTLSPSEGGPTGNTSDLADSIST